MRRRGSRRIAWALPLALACVGRAQAQTVPSPEDLESEVKAAYLVNFTKYVVWPDSSASRSAPLTLCVAAQEPFFHVLQRVIADRRSGGRELTSLLLASPQDVATCSLIFIPSSVTDQAEWLRAFRRQAVLTVGDGPGFAGRDGMIGFVLADETVRFEVNVNAVRTAGLGISSRVLSLALRVRGAEEH